MSNSLIDAAFAAELAQIIPTVEPVGDVSGFGVDLSCYEDIRQDAGNVTGLDLLYQSDKHRLSTRRGVIPDAPDYGTDIFQYLNEALTPELIRAIRGAVRNELLKDDRHLSIEVEIEVEAFPNINLHISGETSAGPYQQVFAVNASSNMIELLYGGTNN